MNNFRNFNKFYVLRGEVENEKKIIIILISVSIIFLTVLISGIMLRTEVEKLNLLLKMNLKLVTAILVLKLLTKNLLICIL